MPVPLELARGRRLVVIDDEAPFLRTVQRVLERLTPQWHVVTAEGGVDGLLKVGALRPDAVILDAIMPGMDGVEVCRRIKALPEVQHAVVVAVSARLSSDLRRRFERAGASACLAKPLDFGELLRLLDWQQPADLADRSRLSLGPDAWNPPEIADRAK